MTPIIYEVRNPMMKGHSSYREGRFTTRQEALNYIAEYELLRRQIVPINAVV